MALQVQSLILPLLKKVSDQDFKGYDPYDLKAHPFFISLIKWGKKNKLNEILREVILELTYHYPVKSRKLFGIEKSHNAKALGLIGTSCLEMSLLEELDSKSVNDAQSKVDKLLQKYRQDAHGGIGWGYPFDWQSTELIPAHTPNGIVTTAVGEYYWTRYKLTNNSIDLDACTSISSFLKNLPIDRLNESQICFSYIPHYQNHVHNLNLFVADFLIKTGMETENQEWIDLGTQAVNYTIADQHENGAFDYNGPPETPQNFIDNYHTGFVLRMLGSIYRYTNRDDVKRALKRGLNYYLDTFFTNENAPRLKPDRTYRIDIHSAAEAINCLTFLSSFDERAFPKSTEVLIWTLDNLYDEENHDFYYGMMKSRFTGRVFRSEIKYMRWAQAWMLRALSRYMLYSNHKQIIS